MWTAKSWLPGVRSCIGFAIATTLLVAATRDSLGVTTMPEAVLSPNEISLNGVRYPITKPVLSSLSSLYPEKLVTGDYSKDSQRDLSVLGLSDHRGGIGLDVMEGQGDTDRSWYSTADIRYKGHLILPPLVTNTANLPTNATAFGSMVTFKGAVYGAIVLSTGTANIYKYNNATDTWGSALQAVSNALRHDAIAGMIGGTQYVVFSDVENIYYSTDGAAWTTNTTDAKFLAIWDDKLWGLQASGQLWYWTAIGGTVINDAMLAMGASTELRGLIVGRNAAGDEILYAVTAEGLWAHDFTNSRFIKTAVDVPSKTTSTYEALAIATRWRDALYFVSETGLFEYIPGGDRATLRMISPEQQDGLPSGKGATVAQMQPTLYELLVGMNGSGTDVGILLAWNGHAWRVLAELAASENFSTRSVISGVFVSGAYGVYRVWFASPEGDYIKHMPLPVDQRSPLRVTTYTYAAAATHDWPWFTAGQSEVTKVAVRLKVETRNPTTSETVKVYYAIDRSTTFQIMTNSTYTNGTITAAGVHTFDFPSVDSWVSTTAKTGTAFRSIQFRVVFARGSTNTNTPDVLSLSLEYYKKLDPKWAHQLEIDLHQDYGGKSPKELRAALLTAIESSTLVEFTFRDPDTNSNATFYVQVRSASGLELTGHDERGTTQVELVEV